MSNSKTGKHSSRKTGKKKSPDRKKHADTHLEESGESILLEQLLENNSQFQLLEGKLSKTKFELSISRHILSCQTNGIVFVDTAKRIVYANPVFCTMTGYALEDLEKKMLDQFFMLPKRGPGLESLLEMIAHMGSWQGEVFFRQGNDSQLPLNMSINYTNTEEEQQDHSGFVCQFSVDKALPPAHTPHSSPKFTHDPLTGLPDRPSCQQYLSSCIDQAKEINGSVGILYVDLDHFKRINSMRGPSFGDELLCEISSILLQCAKKTGAEFVARFSGDIFVIILPPLIRPEMTEELSKKILQIFQHPIAIKSREIFITLSIGISLFPDDSDNQPELLHNAEMAMEMAKAGGGNASYRWNKDLHTTATHNLDLESDLYKAVENGELNNHYQPQISLKTGAIVGMEALARWTHPLHGNISPAIFIPVAEDSNLIDKLSIGLIEQACRHGQEWHAKGLKNFTMAVNISGRMLQQDNLFEQIMEILEKTKFPPTSLELELTETALIESLDNTINLINQCKAQGIQMALDDFGTGYSSLSYLQRFAVDKLKIDRSFVMGVTTNPNDDAITLAIIAMAKQLNFKVLAEGVETEEQLTFLKENRCDVIQGFLISKPVTADQMKNALIRDSSVAMKHRRIIDHFFSIKARKLPSEIIKGKPK